jgi:hypothetical protein
MKMNSMIKSCCAFASFVASMAFAGQSRADDPFSYDLTWSGSVHGLTSGTWGASCPPSGQFGYCTPGDDVTYYGSAFSLENPHVVLTPYDRSSWVLSPDDYAWCSVAITCHDGGGAQSYYYDEKVDGSECNLNPCNGVADEIWVAVGVSHFPP